MPSDLQKLQRYATTGDAHAFRELVQAHGAMVHATAIRVTRDAAAAQDVAQETFLELARKAGGITQFVAAWLHRVAWNRACDAVRRESTRKRFEEAMAETWHSDREATWPEIEPHVDAALNELPNELREVLVLYFLEGRTQAEVSRHIGRNKATVSRAIERGITAMREALKTRGITCGIGLAALLTSQSAHAMPAALQASLGKLSLTSVGASSAAVPITTAAGSTLIAMTTTTKTLLITGTLATASLPFLLSRPEAQPVAIQPAPATTTPPQNPIAKTNASELTDEEVFDLLFGEQSHNARSLVNAYRAAHPGMNLKELAKDPALTPKLQALMQDMMTKPELGKQFGEAMQLIMKVKGITPSPGVNISLSMGDGFLNTESQAERYLGAVLSNDAQALAQLFADVVTEAAVEMTFDPATETTSTGVSIRKEPLPPGTNVIEQEPED